MSEIDSHFFSECNRAILKDLPFSSFLRQRKVKFGDWNDILWAFFSALKELKTLKFLKLPV